MEFLDCFVITDVLFLLFVFCYFFYLPIWNADYSTLFSVPDFYIVSDTFWILFCISILECLYQTDISIYFLKTLALNNLSLSLCEFTNLQLYGYTLYTKDGLAMLLLVIILLASVIYSALTISKLKKT